MDSDAVYVAQIDKMEAYEGRRKRSRTITVRRLTRSSSAAAVLGVAVDMTRSVNDTTVIDASVTDEALVLDAHVPVWETGLFTCWDASAWHCCLAVVLPCAIASHTEATIDRGSCGFGAFFLGLAFLGTVVSALQSVDMATRANASAWTTQYRSELLVLNMWDIAACVGAAMFAAGVFAFRNMTRHYYHIPGSCCTDAVVATACAPCAMAQISRHFEKAGPSVYAAPTVTRSRALGPIDTLPSYQEC